MSMSFFRGPDVFKGKNLYRKSAILSERPRKDLGGVNRG